MLGENSNLAKAMNILSQENEQLKQNSKKEAEKLEEDKAKQLKAK